ncbi:hypothetical protein CSW98_07245 [Vibrio sp. HA2012]|nr:hypothetical protein CSW98_07245 [Vibrio sp. HA2012]
MSKDYYFLQYVNDIMHTLYTNITQTESVGSTVSGKNIKIATIAMSSQTTIQGFDVQEQNSGLW